MAASAWLTRARTGSKASYLISFVAIVLGVASFVVGLQYFEGESDPLPPQEVDEPSATSLALSPATTPPSVATTEPPLELISERSLASAERGLDDLCGAPTAVVPPASDFAATVAASAPGTCFILEAGEYRFHDVVPKDYMTFLGVGRDAVTVAGDGGTENAFHGTATGVTIGRMTFTGFQGNGGESKAQEQGAIRGTAAIWLSDRGEMAREWLIEDVVSSNNLASGIFLGDHFTVRGSVLEGNGVTGIGGSEVLGGLLEHNVVRNNGEQQATGVLANGGGMKFTMVISPDDPLVVRQNEIYGNAGIGVWCDIGCNGFEVRDNYIHDQRSRAVMFELSRNAVISGNLIVDANTWSDFTRDFNAAAITTGESSDVLIENNYVEGAIAGIIVRQTKRPSPSEGFLNDYENLTLVSERVTVRNNIVVGVDAMGISTGATGRGLIPDPASIRFEANTYGSPNDIVFWWENGDRYNFSEWQASGRDNGGGSSVPPRPSWTLTP